MMLTLNKLIVAMVAYLTILACSNSPHSESTNIVAGDTHLYGYTVDVQVPTFMGIKKKTETGFCVFERFGDDGEAKLLTERGSLDSRQMAKIFGTGYTPSNPSIAIAKGESKETILAIAGSPNNTGVCCIAGGGQDSGISRVDSAIVAIRTFALLSKDDKERELTLSPLRITNIIAEIKATEPNKEHEGQCKLP